MSAIATGHCKTLFFVLRVVILSQPGIGIIRLVTVMFFSVNAVEPYNQQNTITQCFC